MEDSTHQYYKDFDVLSLRSVYKKCAVIWDEKNNNYWNNIDPYKSKGQHRALNVKVNYDSKCWSQKCIDYLKPTIFIRIWCKI